MGLQPGHIYRIWEQLGRMQTWSHFLYWFRSLW